MNTESIHIPRDIIRQLPTALLRGLLLTLAERADNTGRVCLSVRALAEDLDIGYQSLRTAMKHLTNAGLIVASAEGRLTAIVLTGFYRYGGNPRPDAKCDIAAESPEVTEIAPTVAGRQESVDYEKFRTYYNSMVAGTPIPTVIKISDSRKRALKSIFAEFGKQAVQTALQKVIRSDFLSQKWGRVNFDWIFNRKNFLKILEGTYDNRTDPTAATHPNASGSGVSRTATIEGVAAEILRRNHAGAI
ncbi:MAG: hypothetical protein K2O78_09120 [Muribaculaceae bacterium]|nr:hypothetical protein [Muribaculaceae bacterium]